MRWIGGAVPVGLSAVVAVLLAAGLAGCADVDRGRVVAVVTPAASATAGAAPGGTGPAGPGSTGPGSTGSGPAGSGPAGGGASGGGPTGPGGAGPGGTGVPAPAPGGPVGAYLEMAADWQRARGTFFSAVSDSQPRTVAQQRALAASYLVVQRSFAVRLAATAWPAGAQRAVRALVAVNREQQANLAGMTRAGSAADFTGWLGRYGLRTAAENAAVDAVALALR
jgi:hypothetical protein